ncbi:protein TSSC4 [Cottoperca gobio]|uniref:U5 small nuclear ribonucleoprotein TSSC4 n=1 Tax=Cottoperca gobio TaxID=56716 RepID=A0A6J2SAA5_COTGO|nr:protein TSSC4 [Cottoperca gobio]
MYEPVFMCGVFVSLIKLQQVTQSLLQFHQEPVISADQQRQHGHYNRSTNMVIDVARLPSLVVKMCDQKNGSDHGDDVDDLSASDESEPEERPSNDPFDPELDCDDDDDDDEGHGAEVKLSAPAAGHRAQSAFSLRGGGSAFSNRSQSIFECLDSVARLASSSSSLNHHHVTDGVFTRPLPPPPSRKTSQPPPSCPTPAKKRGVPDYLVHPERWTHYSLEDVTETSDQGNSRAAHHFLSSVQQRKEQQESPSDSSCNMQHKMIFSRPSGLLKEQLTDPLSAGRDKETCLRHLEEEEEEGREKETCLSHTEEEDEDEKDREKEMAAGRRTEQKGEKAEEKDMKVAVSRPEEKKQVQEEEGEEGGEAFTSFRKTKRKNYRKSSGREDN